MLTKFAGFSGKKPKYLLFKNIIFDLGQGQMASALPEFEMSKMSDVPERWCENLHDTMLIIACH